MGSVCKNVVKKLNPNKQRAKEAKKLCKTLQQQMFLPEVGTFGYMFETLSNDTAYLCKICKCTLSRSEMVSHPQDSKHKFLNEQHRVIFKEYYEPKPRMMDETDPNTNYKLLNALYRVKDEPLLGVEYILEIVFNKTKKRKHICGLCSFMRCTPVLHLSGTFHKMMYVRTHFKTAHRHFGTNKVKKIRKEHKLVLNKLAAAIESTYGRLKPYQIIVQDHFSIKKTARLVNEGQHFSESDGPTFEDLVLEELARVFPEGESNMANNEVSSTQHDPSTTVVKMEHPYIKKEEDIDGGDAAEEDDYEEKMKIYHKLVKGIKEEMNEVLLKHRQNPEDHPKYNEEWRKFWKKRHMELLSEGKDPKAYDFNKEWKEIWDERMLKFHNEEIESKKIEAKEMLGLIDESVSSSSLMNSSREVVLLNDYDDVSRNRTRKKSRSPFSMSLDSSQGSNTNRVLPSDAIIQKKSKVYHENAPRRDSHSSTNSLFPSGNSSLSSKRSPLRKMPPSQSSSSFSNRRDSPSHNRNSPSRRRDSPFRRRDSPSRGRDSPFRRRDSPSRRRVSPLRRRVSPLRRRVSPLRRRRSRSRSRGSRSRSRDSPRRRRVSPLRARVSPLRRRESPRRSNSPSRRREKKRRDRSGRRSRSIRKSSETSLKRRRDSHDKYSDSSEDIDNNLVALLGKLAALEDELGPLGPKVIGLLSNALAMENKKLNSSEDLLNNQDNYVLFENVIRRLKGLLESGSVDKAQRKVFENVLCNAESVINRAKRKMLRDGQEFDNVIMVPGVGFVDKEKISMQIVSTLLAQGKRDITQEELDEMIRVLASRDGLQSTASSTNLEPISRTNKEENNHLSRLEEKRMVEMKKLQDTRFLVNSLMENQQNSSSMFSKTANEGFSNPRVNMGGAYFPGNTNQPLLTYEHLQRGGPTSYRPMAGKSNFE